MRRLSIFAVLFIFAVAGVFGAAGRETSIEGSVQLPVTEVVLFSTGVGYFERNGTINGNRNIDLLFDTSAVNDLLKSLVLQDFNGGTISSVNYASREPARQTLQSLSVNLAVDPGFLQIISQLRGEPVEFTIPGGRVFGSVVGVESTGSGFIVNLLDRQNRITSISAAEIEAFRAEDPLVQEELRKALVLLAESRYSDTKRVSIQFVGEGTRRVLVGYILPTPIWKTSYRVVVGEEDHLLQGWAIVENMTRDDWDGVSLTLVSGRPVSFTMDLYRAIMVPRPSLAVEVAETIVSPVYEEAEPPEFAARPSARLAAPMASEGFAASGMGAGDFDDDFRDLESSGVTLDSGVTSAASGQRAGEFFQYVIDEPLSLARRESAMVPIVTERVSGEKLSIFNRSTHPVHPFNSLRIENTTSLDLAGGPITLFEAGAYAGDARIGMLSPGDEALLSYSLDLAAIVSYTNETAPDKLERAIITSGLLTTTTRSSVSTLYTISWTHDDGRVLVIEHPRARSWELTAPDAEANVEIETTNSYYRFSINPAVQSNLEAVEERVVERRIDLAGAGDGTIQPYVNNASVPRSVRNALEGILGRRAAIQITIRDRREIETRRSEIVRDQVRIRENLSKINEESDLYSRYLDLLDAQETELSEIALGIIRYEEQEITQREELAAYIEALQAN